MEHTRWRSAWRSSLYSMISSKHILDWSRSRTLVPCAKDISLLENSSLEVSLLPFSDQYVLIEPRSIPWNTCELRFHHNKPSRRVQYAELFHLCIKRKPEYRKGVKFAQRLHQFQFRIRVHVSKHPFERNIISSLLCLQLHSTEHQISATYQHTMHSLPFGIANHICQTPELVTRVIIDDIRRFGTVCRNREGKRSIVYSLSLSVL